MHLWLYVYILNNNSVLAIQKLVSMKIHITDYWLGECLFYKIFNKMISVHKSPLISCSLFLSWYMKVAQWDFDCQMFWVEKSVNERLCHLLINICFS